MRGSAPRCSAPGTCRSGCSPTAASHPIRRVPFTTPAISASSTTGAACTCVDAPEAWVAYRASRNITSHTYREDKAAEVLAALLSFVGDVRFLLSKVTKSTYAH
jgi:hypothetical protein